MIENGAEKSPILLALDRIVLYELGDVFGLEEGVADEQPDEDPELVFVPGLVVSGQPVIIKPKLCMAYLVVIK